MDCYQRFRDSQRKRRRAVKRKGGRVRSAVSDEDNEKDRYREENSADGRILFFIHVLAIL